MKRENKIKSFGFINVDKPSGIVSSTVVNKIKWLSGVPCGHMGTLDPLASGVLPVGVGNATRLFDYFLEKDKEYEGGMYLMKVKLREFCLPFAVR